MFRFLAQLTSIILHPLLIILYFLAILITINPFDFSFHDSHEKTVFFVYTFVNALVIPVLSIVIMKFLGFVNSFEMKTQKERIGPLIVVGTFYLWMFINYLNNPSIPSIYVSVILGSSFAIFIAFFINNFSKISLHMIGMGGLLMALFILKYNMNYNNFFVSVNNWFNIQISLNFLLVIAVLLSGMVASSRLYLKAHITQDIYGGFLIGILSQLIAFKIIL